MSAKDIALLVMRTLGTEGGIGHVIEYAGPDRRAHVDGRADDAVQHDDRGRCPRGLIAPDATTLAYLKGRPHCPAGERWDQAVAHWQRFALGHRRVLRQARRTLGHGAATDGELGNDARRCDSDGRSIPDPALEPDAGRRATMERALAYMDLQPGRRIDGTPVD